MQNQSSSSSFDNAAEGRNAGATPTSWSFAVGFTLAGLVAAAIFSVYWVPLFLGASLAVTLYPVCRFLRRLMGNRPGLAATVTTLLILFVVIAPLGALVAYGASEVSQGMDWVKETVQVDNLRELVSGRIPAPLRSGLERALSGFQIDPDDLTKYGQRGVEVAQQATPKLAGASAAALGKLILMLLSLFFFLSDGPKLMALMLRISPLQQSHTRELMEEFQSVASASLIGMAFTGIGQATALTIGFAVAGLPHLFFFGVATLVAAFVPLLGTMLVWLPVVVGFGVTGHTTTAIALAVYSLVATNVVDGGLKPLVLKGRMAMHGGLLFMGILGGLSLFGPVGVIAGPLCMAFFTTFLTIYQRDYLQQTPIGES